MILGGFGDGARQLLRIVVENAEVGDLGAKARDAGRPAGSDWNRKARRAAVARPARRFRRRSRTTRLARAAGL